MVTVDAKKILRTHSILKWNFMFHNTQPELIFNAMHKLCLEIRGACLVHHELPSVKTSIVSGEGLRSFNARAENMIFISPRLSSGTRAAYIMPEDVCLTAIDVNARLLCMCVHVQLDPKSSNIAITFTLDSVVGFTPKEIRVRVHVCGVLLVNVCVCKAFSGLTDGRFLQSRVFSGFLSYATIHPAGTHLVVSDFIRNCVEVFTLPDFQLVKTFVGKYMGTDPDELKNPRGLCFSSAGTLLIADYKNDCVQHWTLDGEWIASYPVQKPTCIALFCDAIAVGCCYGNGVHVFSIESGAEISRWLNKNVVHAIAFLNATTLAIAVRTTETIDLYTLEGVFKRRLAVGIISFGLAVCADGCLLVSDWDQKRVRVFSIDGGEIVTSPFAERAYEGTVGAVATTTTCAYVLENTGPVESKYAFRVYVFE